MRTYSLQTAIDVAKSFTLPHRKTIHQKDCISKQYLRGAWIDQHDVWATDGTLAIRIAHHDSIQEPYLHGYTSEDQRYFKKEKTNYLSIEKLHQLVAKPKDVTCQFAITDFKTWKISHELALLLNKTKNHVILNPELRKLYSEVFKKELFGSSLSYWYHGLPLEEFTGKNVKICYNADYILRVINACSQLKLKEIKVSLYGKHRVIFIEAAGIIVALMPIKITNLHKPIKPPYS